jgi:type I restriction enzyme R subunit
MIRHINPPHTTCFCRPDLNTFTEKQRNLFGRHGLDISVAATLSFDDIKPSLANEDLGKLFTRNSKRSGTRLFDFEDFSNNGFHVVTELTYKNSEDEFRPDIIFLINGMPLAFTEAKKQPRRGQPLSATDSIARTWFRGIASSRKRAGSGY